MSIKGERRFDWTGSFQDLDNFFAELGLIHKDMESTALGMLRRTLLIQGKRCNEIKDKLKQALFL